MGSESRRTIASERIEIGRMGFCLVLVVLENRRQVLGTIASKRARGRPEEGVCQSAQLEPLDRFASQMGTRYHR